MKYVTERRQRSDNDGLLLKSPGDFCMYQDITEEPHLSAMRNDRGTPIVLTEEQLSSLLRRASEEAYTSTIGKWSGGADDEEPMKRRSGFRRKRIDGVNPPSVKGQGRQQADQSSVTTTPSSDVRHKKRPARVRWRSPSVSGRSDDEYFDAPQSPSRSRSRSSRAIDNMSAVSTSQKNVGGKLNGQRSEQECQRRSTSGDGNGGDKTSKTEPERSVSRERSVL